MKEEHVVSYFKNFLRQEGWKIDNVISATNLESTNFGYIPDVLAHKGNDILVGEAKGSEGLRELQTAVGQAITYYYSGGNIIVVVVPQDLEKAAKLLLQPISFPKGGKIGLYVVDEQGKVREEISYKRLLLTEELKEKGKERLTRIAFIRDLTVLELKRLLEKIYPIQRKYNSGTDLFRKLSRKDKDHIFKERKTTGGLSPKSFTNVLITTNNLGLTENGILTPLGNSFALSAINESFENFKLRLLNLLLTTGNFLTLLREIEFLIETKGNSLNESLTPAVKTLKRRKVLKINDVDDYVGRLKDNQLKWLAEMNVLTPENKIKWHVVCDALSF